MNSDPQLIYKLDVSIGIIKICLIIEDRRPDVSSDSQEIRDLGYKYKTILDIKWLWRHYSFIFHSIRQPFIEQ